MKIRFSFVSNSSSSSFIVAHLPEQPWSKERKEAYLKDHGFNYCEGGMCKGRYDGPESLVLTTEDIETIMNTDCVLKLYDDEYDTIDEISESVTVIAASGVFMEY